MRNTSGEELTHLGPSRRGDERARWQGSGDHSDCPQDNGARSEEDSSRGRRRCGRNRGHRLQSASAGERTAPTGRRHDGRRQRRDRERALGTSTPTTYGDSRRSTRCGIFYERRSTGGSDRRRRSSTWIQETLTPATPASTVTSARMHGDRPPDDVEWTCQRTTGELSGIGDWFTTARRSTPSRRGTSRSTSTPDSTA